VDEVRIRPARPGDVPALADLARRTWSDAFGHGVGPTDEAVELEEGRSESYFAAALREKTILVADADGLLVGYVQFGTVGIPDVEVRPGDQELQRLYVETALQGQGLGRTLMEAALLHPRLAAARRIFLQVWNANERAVRLYESFGFNRIGTTTFTVGADVMKDDVMLLDRAAPIDRRR
jgi:ribosomal protein S18 acetylase RimI-like enzyme